MVIGLQVTEGVVFAEKLWPLWFHKASPLAGDCRVTLLRGEFCPHAYVIDIYNFFTSSLT
jgi:hypothetical protein